MDSSTILLSLPKELAEIKRQLISQQNELKLIEQAGREKTRLQFGESETTREVNHSPYSLTYCNSKKFQIFQRLKNRENMFLLELQIIL